MTSYLDLTLGKKLLSLADNAWSSCMSAIELNWQGRQDSNLRISASKAGALTTWRLPYQDDDLFMLHRAKYFQASLSTLFLSCILIIFMLALSSQAPIIFRESSFEFTKPVSFTINGSPYVIRRRIFISIILMGCSNHPFGTPNWT